VTQLNHDLANLGYADSADISALGWDYFSRETKEDNQSCAINSPKPSDSSAPPASAPIRGPASQIKRKAALR
jgi:hypothetical protein